jgi:uncharacterized repeat protein (TIGR04076 family)
MTYKLIGRITDIKGEGHAGHKVGEEIDLTIFSADGPIKGIKLCPFFLNSLFPYLCVLGFGGEFPWEENPNVFVADCPDPVNRVTIRIERIPV